jgi:hypothetical protein
MITKTYFQNTRYWKSKHSMGCTGYTRKIHSDVGVIINFYFAEKYRYKKRRLKNIFS